MVYQIFAIETNKGEATEVYTSHLKVISKTGRNRVLLYLIVIFGALFITLGLNADGLAVVVAGGFSVGFIILFGYLTITLSRKPLDLESLRVGSRGMSILVIYIITLYVFMFLALLPERIPSIGTILLTIAFYIIVLAMIFVTPRNTQKTIELPSGIISFEQTTWALITFLVLATTFALLWVLAYLIGTLLYLIMIFFGPILFFLAIVQVFRKREVSK
jgi:hypothetical protein